MNRRRNVDGWRRDSRTIGLIVLPFVIPKCLLCLAGLLGLATAIAPAAAERCGNPGTHAGATMLATGAALLALGLAARAQRRPTSDVAAEGQERANSGIRNRFR